jgi:hypothetical protein
MEEGHCVELLSPSAENRRGVGATLTEEGEEAVDDNVVDSMHAQGRGVHRSSEGPAPAGFESFYTSPVGDGSGQWCFALRSEREWRLTRGVAGR